MRTNRAPAGLSSQVTYDSSDWKGAESDLRWYIPVISGILMVTDTSTIASALLESAGLLRSALFEGHGRKK
jgi:hypothetical protein